LQEIDVFSRWGKTPRGVLHRLTKKRDISEMEFLVNGASYLPSLLAES